jgi:biopolymer transport protein ExbB
MKMKRIMGLVAMVLLFVFMVGASQVFAQDPVPVADGAVAAAPVAQKSSGMGLGTVIMSSGWLGVVLWLGLFGAMGVTIYLIVDCGITIREQRIIPKALVDNVTAAMAEGDVLKALQNCENEPGPLANVLTAGFSHVEEGFDVIQEAIATAADMETEKLVQKITWISVCANIAPMLGLLGTVQGMIFAFATIATGAPDTAELAKNIAQALYTTAAGLVTAIPAVCTYYVFRNVTNKLVLKMEALTMELIKDLRNVEVVES